MNLLLYGSVIVVTRVSIMTHLFLFVTCLVCLLEANMAFQKFKRISDMKFKPSFVTETVGKEHLIQCAMYCTSKPGCISLSWKPNQAKCLLSDQDVTRDSVSNVTLDYTADWNTYGMPQQIVFLVRGEEGRYTLDFLEATSACNERGARLATPSELLEARSNGLDKCQCGWMSDGRNGFVLQEAASWCWSSFTTGIIYCNYANAAAWCLLN